MPASSIPADLRLSLGPIELRPLTAADMPALVAIANATPEAFASTFTPRTAAQAEAYFAKADKERINGTGLAFAVLRGDGAGAAGGTAADPNAAGRVVVGTTRLQEFDPTHRRCAVGYSWYAPAHHKDGTNRFCKVLLLDYAFDTLAVRRVQFTIEAGNEASRRSVERLGAVLEGRLRQHRTADDGSTRDSVLYSLLAEEWRAVRPGLLR